MHSVSLLDSWISTQDAIGSVRAEAETSTTAKTAEALRKRQHFWMGFFPPFQSFYQWGTYNSHWKIKKTILDLQREFICVQSILAKLK